MQNLTRREFIVVTALAAGFAACTQPINQDQVITTDNQNLETGTVQIPVADGKIPAYRAMPATGENLPTVLVIQEIFGVHEHIQDICRRFAKLGYIAIAPELYARQGNASQEKDIPTLIETIVSKVPDKQVMSDLDATLTWAGKTGKAAIDRLGITGFCWGGRIVWLYAAHNPKVKAGVAWYGRLVGNANPLQPKYPIDIAQDLKVPILGLYGGQDRGIPLDTVTQMEQALQAGKSGSEFVIYKDAPHGFHADYRPSYQPKAATDGWQRLQAWFQQHGVMTS